MKTLIIFFILLSINTSNSFSQNINFIENKNQWDSKILFKADLPSGAVFLEKNCLTYNFFNIDEMPRHHAGNNKTGVVHFHAFKMNFQNCNRNIEIKSSEANSDYLNYFIGNDKSKWAPKVNNYKVVEYINLYSNIDLKIRSQNNTLAYDYIIKPGGKPEDISLNFEGLENIFISSGGNLVIKTSVNQIVETKPFAYQTANNAKSKVECNFIINGNTISFSFPNGYDKKQTLIIDPALIFSTYSGSTADNFGFTATYDHKNNVYAGSVAFATGYPVSTGAYQQVFGGICDIAIIKYNPTGTTRLWATYLGGDEGDMPHSLVVDEFDNLLVFGTSGSSNYPVTTNAYNKIFKGGAPFDWDYSLRYFHGSDIIITKLSEDGSNLLASTFVSGSGNDGINCKPYIANASVPFATLLQGNDSLYYNYADIARGEIIVDNKNNVYVGTCTFSSDFPTTSQSFQQTSSGKQEGVVFKMDPNLTTLVWSSYIGGTNDDAIYSLDLDRNYDVYVAGGTNSTDFPTSTVAYDKTYNGGSADAFVAHISNDGKNLIASSYFGASSYDQAYFVRTDRYDRVYITGQTKNSGYSLIINNPIYQKPNSGQFIAKFDKMLTNIIWSTVFGTGNGNPNISITAFAVDICHRIYLSGWGREWGIVYGWNNNEGTKGMDITPDAIQKVTDGQDFYVMVMKDDASSLDFATFFGEEHNNSYACNSSPNPNNKYSSGQDHVDGGTSRFDKKGNIIQSVCASCWGCDSFPTYPNPGAWSNRSGAIPIAGCNNAVFKINIINDIVATDFSANVDCSSNVGFDNYSNGVTYKWDFGDGTTSSEINPVHNFPGSGTYTVSLISTDASKCNIADTVSKEVVITINAVFVNATADEHSLYIGQNTTLHAVPYNPNYTYKWLPSTGLSDSNIPNPVLTPSVNTTYTVVVSDTIGCTAMDTVVIRIKEGICNEPYIYIPNAFTPNRDNKNDVMYVRAAGGLITKLYFAIYDRWGEKVFETTDTKKGWNGLYRGKILPPDVYDYYIEVYCVNKEKYFKKGNITLIR
ncbi:MAG: T9SS type B sorting domain-containing protein [Bacteroidales bacterium]|jgi:gliding motility-associated-like protein